MKKDLLILTSGQIQLNNRMNRITMKSDFKTLFIVLLTLGLFACDAPSRKFKSVFEIPFDATEKEMIFNGFKKVEYGYFKKETNSDGTIFIVNCISRTFLSGKEWDGTSRLDIQFNKKFSSGIKGFSPDSTYFRRNGFNYLITAPVKAESMLKVYTTVNGKKIYNYEASDTVAYTFTRIK